MNDCPNPEYHGNPFCYCACGWTEATDAPADDKLLAQIAERRRDPEFIARLDRIVAENRDVLDALADGPETSRNEVQ